MEKQTPPARRAIFLDRDGVLNRDIGYAYRPEDLELLDGVPVSLNALKARGFLLIVVTNQSGVARGMYTLEDAAKFNRKLKQEITRNGGPELDAFYICPHHPEGSVPVFSIVCDCRKPKPGLLLQAAKELGIDLKNSWMIGDKESDASCANNAGVSAILVHSDKYQQGQSKAPVVKNLSDAVRLIG